MEKKKIILGKEENYSWKRRAVILYMPSPWGEGARRADEGIFRKV
ncbi:hypothetical protein [Butyrivibrio sp. VCD2006]|nr:hypothetical protein [Butyrivibrio sp. VCD2006]